MSKIIRLYNQNRKMILVIVGTIVAVIVLIQVLNSYYKNNTKDKSSSTNNSTTAYNTNNYSIITQEKIDGNTAEESADLIKNFFDYCNNEKVEEAYNILSNNCKEELFPTVNEFKEKYYNKIFTEIRRYDTVLWINTKTRNTYRVEIMSDLLATGQRESMPIEDYYTIVNEDGEYKLNINRFIGKEEINISENQSNIIVTIVSKKMYVDYELYEIKIENKTSNKIIFNTKENTNSIYLQDENGLKYIAFLNEIANNELDIPMEASRTLQIKFNRGYKPAIDIEKVVFEDIKINNNEQKEKIEIEL